MMFSPVIILHLIPCCSQGENNMGGTKGSALANVGYSCEQKVLVAGWRKAWSETPGTTEPLAPFGIVTLASSGSEGNDAAMGAMRLAQTAGYGVLPNVAIPNSFFAQAGDLEDAWGPASGPCFNSFASQWGRFGVLALDSDPTESLSKRRFHDTISTRSASPTTSTTWIGCVPT